MKSRIKFHAFSAPAVTEANRQDGESKVFDGLALTPSDVERMASQGIPVSLANQSQFLNDDTNKGWSVPAEFQNSQDRNSLWELSKQAKSKLVNAFKADKKLH